MYYHLFDLSLPDYRYKAAMILLFRVRVWKLISPLPQLIHSSFIHSLIVYLDMLV